MNGVLVILALGAFAAAPEEHAPPARLAVVTVLLNADPSVLTATQIVDQISKEMVMRTSLSLISEEDVFVAGGHRQQILDCGSDVACIADSLRSIRADLGLIVLVNFVVDPPLLDLRLVSTDGAQILAKSAAPLEAGEFPAAKIGARAAKLLDEAGHVQKARLLVHVSPARSDIVVTAGTEHRSGPDGVFDLLPGEVTVLATAPGYQARSEKVVLESGKERRVELVLEEESALGGSTWVWVTLSAAAVIAGAAVAIGVAVSDDCFCLTREGVECHSCSR